MASLTQWTWVSASSGRGQGSLVGYSPRGLKESGIAEWPNNIISWLFQHLLSSPLCFLPFLQECRLISATGDTITEIWSVLSRWRDKRHEEEPSACPSPCFLLESSAMYSCLSHSEKKKKTHWDWEDENYTLKDSSRAKREGRLSWGSSGVAGPTPEQVGTTYLCIYHHLTGGGGGGTTHSHPTRIYLSHSVGWTSCGKWQPALSSRSGRILSGSRGLLSLKDLSLAACSLPSV